MIVALYARVSTVKQAEKDLSIPDQLRQLREWCARQGHGVAVTYVEPGASATDDRRPEFQRMMAEACGKPRPYDAILVYSQSRFFRNALKFAIYEDRLDRAGVKLWSLTEPVSEDPAGKFTRHVLSAVHELQSEETGANTLRTMLENARRGFFNGSRPPFGYRVAEVDLPARQWRKKRLVVDEAEAEVVRQVFALYLQGENGHELGLLGVARELHRLGKTYRGTAWTKSRVERVLSNRAYIGEHVFNQKRGKTGQRKPEGERVRVAVPVIVDRATFEAAARRRRARHASQVPPRVVSAPSFLAGLVRCGRCGAGMTIATGKGGRYRYYKCQRKIGTGERCESPNVPAGKLDRAVRETLCGNVVRPERVLRIMAALRQGLRRGASGSRRSSGGSGRRWKRPDRGWNGSTRRWSKDACRWMRACRIAPTGSKPGGRRSWRRSPGCSGWSCCRSSSSRRGMWTRSVGRFRPGSWTRARGSGGSIFGSWSERSG